MQIVTSGEFNGLNPKLRLHNDLMQSWGSEARAFHNHVMLCRCSSKTGKVSVWHLRPSAYSIMEAMGQ